MKLNQSASIVLGLVVLFGSPAFAVWQVAPPLAPAEIPEVSGSAAQPVAFAVPVADSSGPAVIEKVSPSVAMILTGSANGALASAGSGVILRSDGIILTAYHVIKNARQVQVRLQNGEVFDTVELVAFDARCDLAALRISAGGLTPVAAAPEDVWKPGAAVYVVSHAAGLDLTASAGILSGVRMADNVPGAGAGYRLLQFTAPISPGSSGGVLVDAQGRALGLVVGSLQVGQNLNFAVPVERAIGLASPSAGNRLGNGAALHPPYARYSHSNEAGPEPDPVPPGGLSEILKSARTICIVARSELVPGEPLEKNLMENNSFKRWGFVIVKDQKNADLVIRLDRPLFTWDFTFTIVDRRTKAVIGSGKVIAWDGIRAAPGLTAGIVKRIETYRSVAAAEEEQFKPKS